MKSRNTALSATARSSVSALGKTSLEKNRHLPTVHNVASTRFIAQKFSPVSQHAKETSTEPFSTT